MNDITDAAWFLPAVLVAVLLLGLLAWRWFAGRKSPLQKAISDISFNQLHDLVIPSADEGEIHIDELLLTSQGVLILEVKDVRIRSPVCTTASRPYARSSGRYRSRAG
ncbi:MAG: hypothetical protein P8X98_15655 [Woeseiaceae bacterium]